MTLSKGSYIQVNGLNMYYEIHGEGQPLVLLHHEPYRSGIVNLYSFSSTNNTGEILQF